MPATLPANPGKTLDPEFLSRAEAALDADVPAAGSAGADEPEPTPTRQAPPPKQVQTPRADAQISDAEDQPDATDDGATGAGDEQQPEGSVPVLEWTEDGDVQEMAAYYGLSPEDLAEFPDRDSFKASIRAMDRRQLLRMAEHQQTQAQQTQQTQTQQQRPAGEKPNGQQRQQPSKLPDEVLEEALNAEFLDEEQTKTALRAIRDDNRMLRQVVMGLMNHQQQQVADVESRRFDDCIDALDIPDLGKGEELTDENIDRRTQVWEVVHQMRANAARNTGRMPAISKSLVERASYIAFPKVQTQKLRQTLEGQSRRRMGTTVSSRGDTKKIDTAEAADSALDAEARALWTKFQRENGNL